jgi:ornithine cyclodeaminase/alanine dehydrogenase-like protein (mu-crystallin family)
MENTVLYLSRADVEAVGLTMAEIISAVDSMFGEKGAGRTEMPPKPGIHPTDDGFIHAMPAYVPAAGAAGLKWVSAYPENKARGLPYVSGLIVMNDPSSGIPTAVLDCTWVTAMRTAAASAVAARYLARPDSRSLGVVGCGVQGRSNLEAMACLFDLEIVRAYDHRRSNTERYAAEMQDRFGIAVEVVESAEVAVRDMDLVVTGGPILKEPQPTVQAGWLAPGAFASPLDFDSYWTGEALSEINKFATDDLAQFEYYRGVGYFQATPEPYADLGQIVAGEAPGREGDNERTMSMNLGIALEDVVTAVKIVERARERGIGQTLPL